MPPKRGDQFGRFKLDRWLGSGGNATVWLGEAEQGEPAAIKVLRPNRLGEEPLARFRDEVRILKSLVGCPGVVPLIQAHLPETPSPTDLPWHATPLAEPLHTLLDKMSFPEAIAAMTVIAGVLAGLHEDEIYHRDIKPSNILRLDGQWVLSDFGLAAFPGREGVTEAGEKLGPIYYIAPEMLNLGTEKFAPADVYSLAKTIWVVSTGQRYPMPGELLPEFTAARISSYEPIQRAGGLERLLFQCTRTDPTLRPTMRQVQKELEGWMSDSEQDQNPEAVDLSKLRVRLQAATESSVRETEKREGISAELDALAQHVGRLFELLNYAFTEAVPFKVGMGRGGGGPGLITPAPTDLIRAQSVHLRCGSPPPGRVHLWADVTLRLTRQEVVEVGAAWVVVGSEELVIWRSDPLTFMLGSVSTTRLLSQLVTTLRSHLPDAVQRLTELVEAAHG